MNTRNAPAKTSMTTAPRAPDLSDLIAVANKANPTAAELSTALDTARAEASRATEDIERAAVAYRTSLLADEATLARAVEDRRAAEVRVDRCRAIVEALESRLSESEAGAAEDARRARYDEAKVKSTAAAKALREEYPALGRRLRALLRQLAEASIAVQVANGDLPAGGEGLPDPEHQVRSRMGRPRIDLSTKEVELWCFPGSATPLPDEYQSSVTAGPNGTGSRSGSSGPWATTGTSGYVRRRFRRVEYLPETYNQWAYDLTDRLSLPGLYLADDDYWHPGWGSKGAGVLAKLDATEPGSRSSPPLDDEDREPQVEYTMLPMEDAR